LKLETEYWKLEGQEMKEIYELDVYKLAEELSCWKFETGYWEDKKWKKYMNWMFTNWLKNYRV